MNTSPLMQKVRQLTLPFGRERSRHRRKLRRSDVPHRVRASHCHRNPVHVTLRRAAFLPSMRERTLFLAIRRGLSQTARSWFRVAHFSVQADHLHMIVEARDKGSLSRGMMGLSVRLARAFNAVLGRRGALWGGRYHSRALKTPREVRNALVYVLMNRRKHASSAAPAVGRDFDVCSSAWWLDGWDRPPSPLSARYHVGVPPVAPAETWLLRTGWKRHGLIRIDESPRPSKRRALRFV
jgi:putative transposase